MSVLRETAAENKRQEYGAASIDSADGLYCKPAVGLEGLAYPTAQGHGSSNPTINLFFAQLGACLMTGPRRLAAPSDLLMNRLVPK
ncbi:MAG: hypothetical protein ACM3QZ_05285 [Solirubrobacterales bacterium]